MNSRMPGIWVGGGAIEFAFEPVRKLLLLGFRGAGQADRGHLSCLKFSQHLLPNLGIVADFVQVESLQRKACCVQLLIVTTNTIPINQSVLGGTGAAFAPALAAKNIVRKKQMAAPTGETVALRTALASSAIAPPGSVGTLV